MQEEKKTKNLDRASEERGSERIRIRQVPTVSETGEVKKFHPSSAIWLAHALERLLRLTATNCGLSILSTEGGSRITDHFWVLGQLDRTARYKNNSIEYEDW
jgi:hypothetical protein